MRTRSHLLVLLAILLSATLDAQERDGRLRVLILTGDSDVQYHDWRISTPFLRGMLDRSGRFDVKALEQPRGMTASTLAPYDALILNYNGPRWGEESERAVEEFLRSGKGMVAVHGISYGVFLGMEWKGGRWADSSTGDLGWQPYRDIIGASWTAGNLGHAVRHVFPVKWVDREHPISKGLEETFLANDELYHKMDLRPNAHVLATAFSNAKLGGTGKVEPILWTVPFGAGRVVHIPLGHDTESMSQPGFSAAFARSVEWAASGKVTLPARIPALLEPRKDAARVLVVTGGHAFPTRFYSLFDGYDDFVWSHATTPAEAFRPDMKERFDAVVLHDMYEDLPEAERNNLRAFVESGKGVVSIHHSIVDYTKWPWWHEEVIGGKFWTQANGPHAKSAYKEDIEMIVRPAKGAYEHPVMRGVGPLVVDDETYRGMWHSPKITVLMETDHPDNDRPVVYLGPSSRTRSIYIQLGHGAETFRHPGYRTLVHNAVLWAAGRTK